MDECFEEIDECDENAACNNTIGFYDCSCNDGFFGNGWICADSDECAEGDQALMVENVTDHLYGDNDCHEEAFCLNTFGAYNCTCDDG